MVALRIIVVSALGSFLGHTECKITGQQQLKNKIALFASDWPADIRTALQVFHVDPELAQYICCPGCFSLYGPFPEGQEKDYEGVPLTCHFRLTPSSQLCGHQLLCKAADAKSTKPARRFWYQPLGSWLARFLSRTDVTNALGTGMAQCSDSMRDIWHGSAFKDFKGPDGKPFTEVQFAGSEIRLIFSMFVDWFNPFGTKQGGKHVSFGAIYLICNNLPIHLRYRIENVYIVGIIPGPNEPSGYEINHILRPLIDDLMRAWSPGLHLARTALNTFGTLVRCAVIPLICDLLAARKVAGFAGLGQHEGKFCSFCLLDSSCIGDTNFSSWRRRTWAEHLGLAKMWRDAPTEYVQEQIYKTSGVRWSELLRLPYWNPTSFTVVDSMHNFFVGDLQHHCRNVFGMSLAKPASEGRTQPHTPAQQQEELDAAIAAIKKGSSSGLNRLRRGYIIAIANANNVLPHATMSTNPLHRLSKRDQGVGKNVYVNALIKWVSLTFML